MVQLHDAERGSFIGAISDEEFQFLVDELEEESVDDRDYYVSADTVDMLEADGGGPELVRLLRAAVAGRDGLDIRWTRT